jgi:predicted enzyme related to lactoylglutathione lyase
VQFEITGRDGAALKRFYAILFGWEIRAAAATDGNFGVGAAETGIPGRIGRSWDGGPGRVTVYVEVDDLLEHVSLAEELGGRIVAPPREVPGTGVTLALVADPEGHVVGLSRGLGRRPERGDAARGG